MKSPSLLAVLRLCAAAVCLAVSFGPRLASAQVFTNFQSATLILGQTGATQIVETVDAVTMVNASASALSYKGMFAVASTNPGRILLWFKFPTNASIPADVVLGKPNATNAVDGVSASLMRGSLGVGFSPDGDRLIASDSYNHRVMIWNRIPTNDGTAADVVLGQADFDTGTTDGEPRANRFEFPTGVTVAPNGKMLVCDTMNNRVLIWNAIPLTNDVPADVVLGQNNLTQDSSPNGVKFVREPMYSAVSPDGRLVVGDRRNFRATIWNSIPTENGAPADIAVGFGGFPGDGEEGLDEVRFRSPTGVTVSPKNVLAIGDTDNNRVLIYNRLPETNFPAADAVLGQPTFTEGDPFNGGTNAMSMALPFGINFDLVGRLLVNGPAMDRVMVFGDLPPERAELEIQLSSSPATNILLGTSVVFTTTVINNGTDTASNVVVISQLPAGLVSNAPPVAAAGTTYNPISGFWTIPSLTTSQQVALVYSGTVGAGLSNEWVTTFAAITASDAVDPFMLNNATSLSFFVNGSFIPQSFPGDFNGDGFSDLIWEGKLDGARKAQISLTTGQAGVFGSSVEVSNEKKFRVAASGDINLDGHGDLLWHTKLKTPDGKRRVVEAFFGNGAGSFPSRAFVATNSVKDTPQAVADVNGDGALDLLWATTVKDDGKKRPAVAAQFGNGSGVFSNAVLVATNDKPFAFAAAADVTGDQIPDLLFQAIRKVNGTKRRVVQALPGLGGAKFSGTAQDVADNEKKYVLAAVGRFNGDDQTDLGWFRKIKKDRIAQGSLLGASTNGAAITVFLATNVPPWVLVGPR